MVRCFIIILSFGKIVTGTSRVYVGGFDNIIELENVDKTNKGKILIANAITDMGVPTSGTDSFATMEQNIRNISSYPMDVVEYSDTSYDVEWTDGPSSDPSYSATRNPRMVSLKYYQSLSDGVYFASRLTEPNIDLPKLFDYSKIETIVTGTISFNLKFSGYYRTNIGRGIIAIYGILCNNPNISYPIHYNPGTLNYPNEIELGRVDVGDQLPATEDVTVTGSITLTYKDTLTNFISGLVLGTMVTGTTGTDKAYLGHKGTVTTNNVKYQYYYII